MNSIVQLAGIKTAEAPKSQTISSDTRLILSALSAFDKRLESVERRDDLFSSHLIHRDLSPRNVMGVDKVFTLPNGRRAKRGDMLFQKGNAVGQLLDWNMESGNIGIKGPDGANRLIRIESPESQDLDTRAV